MNTNWKVKKLKIGQTYIVKVWKTQYRFKLRSIDSNGDLKSERYQTLLSGKYRKTWEGGLFTLKDIEWIKHSKVKL